jgi:hypothetical protein
MKGNEMSKDYTQYFQGDVWLMRLPDEMTIPAEAELPKKFGKLVLQEGEMTGHHHYVDSVMDRPAEGFSEETFDKVNQDISIGSVFKGTSFESLSEKRAPVSAKLFNATKIAEELVKKNKLLRADLVVGLLEISGGPMSVLHQEHSPIQLPPGRYIVGRQIESVAGEERRVAD